MRLQDGSGYLRTSEKPFSGRALQRGIRQHSLNVLLLQRLNELLHCVRIRLRYAVQEVTVVCGLPTTRVAVLVSALGNHRALAVVGIVHHRDQPPIGALAAVVGEAPEGRSHDVVIAIGSLGGENSLLVVAVLLATSELAWIVSKRRTAGRILALA